MRGLAMLAILVTACGDGDPASCPSETTTIDVYRHGFLERDCREPDGSVRERLVIDAGGEVIEHARYRDGKLDGAQRRPRVFREGHIEMEQRADKPHGAWREWVRGELVFECYYTDGLVDGPCWEPGSSYRELRNGRRTGVWWYGVDGKVMMTRIYGDDTLLAVDGRVVPLPPATISVGGDVVTRTACTNDSCRALFDHYQACELDPASAAKCRASAIETYQPTVR